MTRPLRAVALAALVVVAFSACSNDGSEPERDNEGNVTASADAADVFDIEIGDCIGGFGEDEQVSALPVTPCDDEHEQQVYAITEIPDGDFPGADVFRSQAESDCVTEFEAFVGMTYDDSTLDFTWLEPTEESWEQGDREIVCVVYDPAGPVTGSLEGAAR